MTPVLHRPVRHRNAALAGFVLAYVFLAAVTARAEPAQPTAIATTLLNVSYDVARELYMDIDRAFAAAVKAAGGETVTVNQSHGGSTKQALSVASGLDADVVTMNQALDVDFLAGKGLVAADWRKKFSFDAAPYTTISVF